MLKKIFNLIIYILRYFSILEFNRFKLSGSIDFGSKNANNFFKKKLKNSKFFLEYGSGNSTIFAKKLKKKFLSIETDKCFYNFIKKKKIENIYYSNIGPTKYYSYPIMPTFLIKRLVKNYGNSINFFYKKFEKVPDLILIDGRFRVFVTLTVIKFCLLKNKNLNTTIIIDDFKLRKNYHVLKNIIKIKNVGRFGVINLNKKIKVKKMKIDYYLHESILNFL